MSSNGQTEPGIMTEPLPSRFRKADIAQRRQMIEQTHGIPAHALGTDAEMVELADVMVESAVGYIAVPLGVATGFLVDNQAVDVPMATEEPSIIAAATYGASIVRRAHGFTTAPAHTITTGQLFIERPGVHAAGLLVKAEESLRTRAAPLLERMERRGGGWRGMEVRRLVETGVLELRVDVDVRDAMGANIVNSVMESLRADVESISGGRTVMAILTNTGDRRIATAGCEIPVDLLARSGLDGAEVARRIVVANRIACESPSRAVTHNKGIMNGVTAVALATGNDTRALEAAAHYHALRDGSYRTLTRYEIVERDGRSYLSAQLSMPVVLGVVGGAAGMHPASAAALELLGRPSAARLTSIAVSVGLAQNLAALGALVTEGIQRGHMGLHAERVAWAAGARGPERRLVVEAMRERHEYGADAAGEELARLRATGSTGGPADGEEDRA